MSTSTNQLSTEQQAINQLAKEFLNENRTARRWNIFFKILFAIYALLFFVYIFFGDRDPNSGFMSGSRHTAVIKISGVISDNEESNATEVISNLERAYENENTAGIILQVNSPGGSPVQSGLIARSILGFRKEYPDMPIYAVITDIGASGAYYVSVAANQIYADPASIVGSIGVVMAGFGFVDAIEKLGIERRIYTSGKNKAMLDPFSPQKPNEIQHVDSLLTEVHQQFSDFVLQNRGERIKGELSSIFSGLFWTGEQALALGLIDDFGSVRTVAAEVIGEENIIVYEKQKPPILQLLGVMSNNIASTLWNKIIHQSVF